jgi:putative transposase
LNVSGLNERVDNWPEFFGQDVDTAVAEKMRKHEQTGRPLGSENFVVNLERILDRMLRPKKAGRKPKKEMQKRGSEHGK